MRGQTYVILSIVFVILVAIFAVTNVDSVQVNYLVWSGEAPLILVILFSVLMGCVITAAAGAVKLFRLQKQLRSAHIENQQMKNTLEENGLIDQTETELDMAEDNANKSDGRI